MSCPFFRHFEAVLLGAIPFFGQSARIVFTNNPQKKVVFCKQSPFWGLFWDRSKGYYEEIGFLKATLRDGSSTAF